MSRNLWQLWSTTPPQDLRDLVLGHLGLLSRLHACSTSEKDQARLTAAASDTSLLAAWLAEDLWDPDAVQRHYQDARSYAERSEDNVLQAYVAGCMSCWATVRGNGNEAVRAIQWARALLPSSAPATAHAWVAAREATAYAAARDEPAASGALLRAEETLEKASGLSETTWPWVFPMSHQDVSRHRGLAAVDLGLPQMVVPALTKGLDSVGPAPTKRRAC